MSVLRLLVSGPASEDASVPVNKQINLHMQHEHEQSEGEAQHCFHFRVRMQTKAWRLRVRLARECELLDAERIQLLVGDRIAEDEAAWLT